MNTSLKETVVSSLLGIAYFWMNGEMNPQASLSMSRLLAELDVPQKYKERVQNIQTDWDAMYAKKYKKNEIEVIKIPDDFAKTEDGKYLWVASMAIINLFNEGHLALASENLIDMSSDWNDLYVWVIGCLKNQDCRENIQEWALIHFLMAMDMMSPGDELNILDIKIRDEGTRYIIEK